MRHLKSRDGEWNHVHPQNCEDLFDAVKKVGDVVVEIYYSQGGIL